MTRGLGPLDHAAVVEAVARWSFIPLGTVRVETDDYQVLRLPSWWEHPLELRWFRPAGDLDDVLDEVLVGCRESDQPHVSCWVRMDAPAGYEEALLARGGRLDETLDVLARDLTDGAGEAAWHLDPPGDVEVRWATDRATFSDAMRLGAEVFGGDGDLSDADLDQEWAQEVGKHGAGDGGSVVAYVDGRAVGTAGLSLVGPDARLWGGGVLPDVRRRGVYRALLVARLRYAVKHGGRLALVKGRVQTSGPILRRAGFEKVGQERSYLVDL